MIIEKTLAALAAGAAIVAAAAVSVVAAAFALYALLLPYLGPAGSAAVLAVVFAILALGGGLLAARKAEGKHRDESHADDAGLVGKLFELAKEKPLIAAGAAVAAGIFALRNPAVLTAVISAFVAGSSKPPPPKR